MMIRKIYIVFTEWHSDIETVTQPKSYAMRHNWKQMPVSTTFGCIQIKTDCFQPAPLTFDVVVFIFRWIFFLYRLCVGRSDRLTMTEKIFVFIFLVACAATFIFYIKFTMSSETDCSVCKCSSLRLAANFKVMPNHFAASETFVYCLSKCSMPY